MCFRKQLNHGKKDCAQPQDAGFCGIFYIGAKGMIYGFDKFDNYMEDRYNNVPKMFDKINNKIEDSDKSIRNYAKQTNSNHLVNIGFLVVTIPIAIGGIYACGYRIPKYYLQEANMYLKNFAQIFRGTQCCDMVRATAKFSFLAPWCTLSIFGSLGVAFICGLWLYNIATSIQEEWEMHKND